MGWQQSDSNELASSRRLSTRSAFCIRVSIFCVIYALTAVIGLKFTAINQFAALIWPPTGIAFAGLIFFGIRYWPAVFVGAFIANAVTGASVPVAFGIAIGNTLEAVVAVTWCLRISGFHTALDRSQDVLRLIIRAAMLSTLLSAGIGVLSLWLGGSLRIDQLAPTALQWWAGDALSDLTFAPMALFVLNFAGKNLRRNRLRLLEAIFFVSVISAFSMVVLSSVFVSHFAVLTGLKGIYMLVPLLLWGALRFGQSGAIVAAFLISEISMLSTAFHVGPFSGGTFAGNVLHLLVFVLIVALTGLIVGSVVTERENERRDLKLSQLELKKREFELEQAKQIADRANAAKTAFLANMSHEIRTPLGAVMGFSELLANPAITDADRKMSIEAVSRNGRLLSNIIDDILDLSRVEAGKLPVEKTKVRLAEVLSDVSSLLGSKADEKGVLLKVSTQGSVPETIETDPLRLQQVLLNIIGNAIKFTKHGSVEVVAKSMGSSLAFVVSDTGQGISPDQSELLFNPFTQADASTTRKFGGTGLGLSLSKKIAQALGGDVVLSKSTLGIGSTFTVLIDAGSSGNVSEPERDLSKDLSAQNSSPSASIAASAASAKTQLLKDLSVLVVDDSFDNQALVSRILGLAGASVKVASDGAEAVAMALANENHFDVILMDLQMPKMDGYTATQELRKSGYIRPIIALSAHAMTEERQRTLQSGFDHHISKPIDQKRLLAILAEMKSKRSDVTPVSEVN